jgi:hypothetical protein
MTVQHYSKAGSPFQYIAARMGGPFDPLPSWFPLLQQTGNLRYDSEHNVEVRTITGAWQSVQQGDWVVLQRADPKAGVGFDKCAVWHVEHEDFIKLWNAI